MHSPLDGTNGALPGRLSKGARGMRASVGAIWSRAVVGRPEGRGGKEPVRRAPEVGEPAGASGDGELPDDQPGSCDGRVGVAPGGEPPEQQKSTPSAETDVVAQGKLPSGGRADGTRGEHYHRRRAMGGTGSTEGRRPAGGSAMDGWVAV